MHPNSSVLAVAGSLCLTITLVLAWCLVGVRSSTFYLLFAHLRVPVSPVILVSMSVGSLMNPVRFLALAVKPDLRQHPASVFCGLMGGSFTLTTIGYVGAA